ncbi:hypothetical protein GCM10019059_42120 [Camelimonas fluminis]|uniref:Uncharacterized protein n=1 Tax=Camelimonas fluminis TaxID=1576911 RepID=A0ABV7UC80_9HYPH|nr:hypothetical protein [Camelimonas fluminis]GHE79103.1 hypothetical protein GCM10019059_42120 [Camelimonas fluminis]
MFKAAFYASVALLVFCAPAVAGPLGRVEAVEKFLGIGMSDGARAGSVASDGADVVVRDLTLPLGVTQREGAPVVSSSVRVKELRFVDVAVAEATARFAGVTALEVVVTGAEGVAVRSMALGPVKAVLIGSAPLSVEGDYSATLLGVVSSSAAGAIRADMYAVSYRSEGGGRFSQKLKVSGLQLRDSGRSEYRVAGEISIAGDRAARTVEAEMRLVEHQLGEIIGQVSMSNVEMAERKMSLIVGDDLADGNADIRSGSVEIIPSEAIRMVVRFLPSDKRDELIGAIEPILTKNVPQGSAIAGQAMRAVAAFLAKPGAVRLSMAPKAPVPVQDFVSGKGFAAGTDWADRWGVSISVSD